MWFAPNILKLACLGAKVTLAPIIAVREFLTALQTGFCDYWLFMTGIGACAAAIFSILLKRADFKIFAASKTGFVYSVCSSPMSVSTGGRTEYPLGLMGLHFKELIAMFAGDCYSLAMFAHLPILKMVRSISQSHVCCLDRMATDGAHDRHKKTMAINHSVQTVSVYHILGMKASIFRN